MSYPLIQKIDWIERENKITWWIFSSGKVQQLPHPATDKCPISPCPISLFPIRLLQKGHLRDRDVSILINSKHLQGVNLDKLLTGINLYSCKERFSFCYMLSHCQLAVSKLLWSPHFFLSLLTQLHPFFTSLFTLPLVTSFIPAILFIFLLCSFCLEPFSAVFGQWAGCTLTAPTYRRANTEAFNHSHSHSHKYG